MENIALFIIVQSVLIISISYLAFQAIKFKRVIALEKRILKFSVFSITDKPVSFSEKIENEYLKLIKNISKIVSTSKIAVNHSKVYEKYLDQTKIVRNTAIDIISNKLLISVIAVVIMVVSDVLRSQPISLFQAIIALLFGYFLPDIFLVLSYKQKQKKIEEDFLKAVIIMSNAFKSGRSIMQAIEFVSKELDGPVSEEFKRMYIDLTYGLELEVVFERLANRINLDETKYMASSLVILNKTGGNVVKVFSSIERSFFERKKLNDELKSVTALSNFVFKILVVIPFIIFIMIYILNPQFFAPFITTTIGNILLGIIIFIYVLYIVVVKRVIKIREW